MEGMSKHRMDEGTKGKGHGGRRKGVSEANGGTEVAYHDSFVSKCDGNMTVFSCTDWSECEWHTGHWEMCSTTCGSGVTSREASRHSLEAGQLRDVNGLSKVRWIDSTVSRFCHVHSGPV